MSMSRGENLPAQEYAINIFMHGNYNVNRGRSLHKAQNPLK